MKGALLCLFVLLLSQNAFAFDYASYESKDLDDIVSASAAYDPEKTEGQSLLIPPDTSL